MLGSLPTIRGSLTRRSFEIPEILQRGNHIQVDVPPERLANRGRRPGSIRMLYGVEVDGEREPARVPESVPSKC